MTDHAHPDRPELRLSDAEREAAVADLAEAFAAGRLTGDEYAERATAARAAVTRGDLAPLFTDLPAAPPTAPGGAGRASGPAGYGASSTPPPASSTPPFAPASTPTTPPAPAPTPTVPPAPPVGRTGRPRRGDGTGGALGGTVGATIMALVPITAFALFLITGFAGGWAWSWAWFLLVPVAGIIIYGPGSDERRRRGR
ncbi:DUF1707 SHOCT-like domain-containing protein [Agromyces salentinus]|nr:DUF1707 domain-containing protein [Agromyces salentinus]